MDLTLVLCFAAWVAVDAGVPVCQQPKKIGPCRAKIPRYYYNSAKGRCEKFFWGGCAPNGNNFETCLECSVRCSEDISLPCLPFEPSKPTEPIPPTDACDQPMKVGPCRAAIPRFFYNSASGRCEKFTWGGCEPNGNNFETCGECNLRCSTDINLPCQQLMPGKPNEPTDVCSQPKIVGMCRAAIPRYYFNSESGRCEKFIYGGCGANGNNFETCAECKVKCSTQLSLPCVEDPNIPPEPIQPVNVCVQPKDPGPCYAYIPRYYYNSASGRCEKFIYGGCLGNGNNFETCVECSVRCSKDISLPCLEEPSVPTPTLSPVDVCELPKDPSRCQAYVPRYYYNSASGKCERFIWGGCPGNENNFETCLECSLRCERKGVPAY